MFQQQTQLKLFMPCPTFYSIHNRSTAILKLIWERALFKNTANAFFKNLKSYFQIKRAYIVLSILISFFQIVHGQNCNLSTQCGDIIADWGLANNVTFVCEGAPFEVQVNSGTTMNGIDEIIWLWDDGLTDTVNNFSNQTHVYTIDDMDACSGAPQKIYEITMEIYRFCADGTSCHYQTSPVAVKFKPRAFFEFEPVVCVGDQVEFQNTSCNADSFSWNFGDGFSSTDENPVHEYANANFYQVSLVTENECGTSEITQTIEVIDPVEANIANASNNVNVSSDTFIYCLGSGIVDLNGDSLSINEDFYEWNNLNNVSGASWELPPTNPPSNDPTPNIYNPSIDFSQTGLYQFILEVDNACNRPDYDTILIQVLSGQSLSEPSQYDACLTLDYEPDNFNPNAVYTINGAVEADFPVTLGVGVYTVVCSLVNECGSQTTTDVFEVFGQEDVSIISPPDTTVCVGPGLIPLLYNPDGGTWTGEHLIVVDSTGEVFFDPVEVGSFQLSYRKGVGDCEDVESITINVEGVSVVTSDYEVCSTSAFFVMGATPPGGNFSSADCPDCISGSTFSVQQMELQSLTTVTVDYIVTSTSGCDGNDSFTVSIEDPSADFFVDDVFCLGTPVTVNTSNTAGTLTWLVDGQDIGPPAFTNLASGFHTIELTAAAGNCKVVESFEIYITSPPSDVSFTATPLEGCADLEVMLFNETGPFDNPAFEWHLDNDSLLSTDVQLGSIILPQGLNDTTYTISLSAGNSCDGQIFSQDITVFPRPVPRFGPMQNHYCSGDTVTFSNVSFGGPMSSWLWDYGNGITSTDSIPLEMVYLTDTIPTTYTVSLTATNACGTKTFLYDIVINPTDVRAFFNVDLTEGCVGNEICLSNLSTLGAPVLWDFGDGNTSTQPNICHTYLQPGTYTITLKAFGCGFDSIQATVVIHPKPTAGFTNNSMVCPLDTLSFMNTSNLAVDFLWDFGDGETSTLNNPAHFYDSAGSYEVKLYATTLEGCIDSSASSITVLTPPTADFNVSTDSICENQDVVLTSISIPTPLSCFWDFGDGSTSNECTETHAYETAGDYIATLTITDSDGCRGSAQQLVHVAPVPIPAFVFIKDQECSPVEVIFTNQTLLGESYMWAFGDGNTSMKTNPTHTYTAGGDYTVQLIAINGVCSNSTSQTVSINQTPAAAIAQPIGGAQGCAELEVAFTASPVGSSYTYKWDFDDNLVSFEPTPIHIFQAPGVFNVTLIVGDGPCADTATIAIEVFEPVEATIASVDNLCYGDLDGSINLNVTSGTPDFSYEWSNGPATPDNDNLPAGTYSFTITDNNHCTFSEAVQITQPDAPLSINILQENIVTCYGGTDGALTITAEGSTPDYTYLWESGNTTMNISNVPAGQYPITVTDANGCVLEEIQTVSQNDSISYSAEVSNISCFGFEDGQIMFENFTGGVPPYFATVLQLDSLQGTGFNGLIPGNYNIVLADGAGCTQFFSTEIIEPPLVWIELDIGTGTDSIEILMGEEVDIYSTYNISNPIFTWIPDQELSCNDCNEPTARPFDDTEYVVLMTDENGCIASDSIFIAVKDERRVAIPNAFTPNNDGENDVFTLLGNNPGVEEITSFQVFDRWGGILYEAKNFQLNDPEIGWDGKYKGTDAQVGNYVYIAEVKYVDGKSLTWKGGIMLIR